MEKTEKDTTVETQWQYRLTDLQQEQTSEMRIPRAFLTCVSTSLF